MAAAHRGRSAKEARPQGVRLYIVRHAIAAERGAAWPDDTKRPLTLKGIARMRKGARGLRALGVSVDLILTSPLVRARQTADVLLETLRPVPRLAVVDALAPDRSPRAVAEALARFDRVRRIAIVGHEPGLGEFAAWLIGASAPLVFRKGGVARIDVPAWPPSRHGRLVWIATPRMLRKLKT